MALKRKDEIKIVENDSILTLKPNEGEGIIVKRIEVKGDALPDMSFAEITIGRASCGYFAVNVKGYNHLAPLIKGITQKNIFDVLKEHGRSLTFPVPEGYELNITLPSNADFIKVTYDVYDAGDVHPDAPNGAESKELTYLAYFTNAKEWTTGDYYTIDKILNPVEYPDFPVNPVPSKATIEIFGFFGIPLAVSVGNGTTSLGISYTTRVRLYYQRKVLFDPDRKGWLFLGKSDYSVTETTKSYDYTEVANELPFVESTDAKMKIFDEPLKFGAGEELNLQIGASIDSDVSIEAEKLIIGAIMRVLFE
jgi:hypothetical protein